jgi:outer membrane protein OmpA-like peptidoglycan-associated protein
MSWRKIAALTMFLLAPDVTEAQDIPGRTLSLTAPVLDLAIPVQGVLPAAQVAVEPAQKLYVRETATETRIELPADILFAFDKADIRPSAQAALKQAADIVRQRAKGVVRVEGHSDSKGTPAYNQRLSERRAASVQQWLVERESLRTISLAIQGFGASRPVAPNSKPDGSDSPEGRQKNRRVEIVFGKTGSP